MNAKKRLLIIIVNYNGEACLTECLESLVNQDVDPSFFDVCLVDNGSSDDSIALFQTFFPQGEVIAFEENTGFAYPNNHAWIRNAGLYDYYFLLNNDTLLASDFMVLLEGKLKRIDNENEKWGAIVPLMRKYGTENIVDNLGIHPTIWGLFYHNYKDQPLPENVPPRMEVFGGCGGALILKGKMLEEIELFEESFFAYYEDVDLALRMQLAGWKALAFKDLLVDHKHSQTLKSNPARKKYLIHRNQIRTLFRNLPLLLLILNMPIFLIVNLASLLVGLIKYRSPLFLQARLEALKCIKKDLLYRRSRILSSGKQAFMKQYFRFLTF